MEARTTTTPQLTLTVRKVANLSATQSGQKNVSLSGTTVFTTIF